ncbi:MAG: lipopolysaccharide heptosyltransferase I [Nitrospirae bacterium]|nr:lipopolysaccharide heptosyltransferase I [Nitrospirota bacterium]
MAKKILIIKPSSLGDVIHALPFLKTIKDAFPDAHIAWVLNKSCEGILSGNPMIDELIIFDKDPWGNIKSISKTFNEIKALIKTLRAKRFDIVIDLQGLLRSGIMTFFARSPLKIGFENAREGSKFFYNKKVRVDTGAHAVDRYLEVARVIQKEHRTQNTEHRLQSTETRAEKIEFPLYVDKAAEENIKKLLGGISNYVVIVSSARWQSKRWPAEYFGMLISGLSIPCIITGTASDKETVQKVMDASGGEGINFCSKINLKELAALLSGAKAVISADSGPLHIAAALGVPVVALFGPTDSHRTGPYGWQRSKKVKLLRASISCSPCFKKKCKNPLCMSNISVEMVSEELKEYL